MSSEAIDYKEMYRKMKSQATEDIKVMTLRLFFNNINRRDKAVIVNLNEDLPKLSAAIDVETFLLNADKVTASFDLIIVKNDDDTVETNANLTAKIKDNPKINSTFYFNSSKLSELASRFPFLFPSPIATDEELIFSQLSLPTMVNEDGLFVGSVFHANCSPLLDALGIKTVFDLGKSKNEKLASSRAYYFFEIDEQTHPEIDFLTILEDLAAEWNSKKGILITCLTGNSLSVAVAIAFMALVEKKNLLLATGVLMKSKPEVKLESWLYKQLQSL